MKKVRAAPARDEPGLARYQALIDAAAQIVWIAEQHGDIVEDSPSWRAFTGQTVEQMAGMGWLDAVHADDRASVAERWQRAVAERVAADVEYRVQHATGGWRRLRLRAVPVLNADGSVREWLGVHADVTERGVTIDIAALEATERALQESELRYRTLFATIDNGFCIIEKVTGEGEVLDFRYVEVNPAFAAQTGVAGVLGKTIREAFPGESEEWFTTYDNILKSGERLRFERGLVTKGRVLELDAFRVEDGTNRRVAVVFKDITDRKLAEHAQARLAAIIESSDDAIVSKDLNGIITSWNVGAERLFGYTPDEAVGKPITIVIPQERLAEETDILDRIRRAQIVDHFETVRRRKDGTLFDVSVTVSPIRDGHGVVVGASKIARDISPRKRADEALREADRRRNEFLAVLAHELRNPLAPIRNSLEVMRLSKQSGAATSLSSAEEVLERQVGQMVRLVDDLLDAGRISQGKLVLRREHVELSSVVHQALDAARPAFDAMDQPLTVTMPPELVFLDADATRLAQIIGNLLSNASKFTDRGGRIWLTVGREGAGVAIRVRDDGIGIERGELSRVFDMFTQVDSSLHRSATGLGIGLTLARTLTEMHGGSVEAQSAGIGQGSEFIVRLPTVAAPELAVDEAKPAELRAERPLKILIVDDNEDSAESLSLLLKYSGHDTHLAFDGPTAVAEAARLQPDAILLDIGLPKLNGYQAARQIREQQGATRPLIVALTGWGQDQDRRQSEDAGFDAHLVKPVDFGALGTLLTDAAARKAIRD